MRQGNICHARKSFRETRSHISREGFCFWAIQSSDIHRELSDSFRKAKLDNPLKLKQALRKLHDLDF